MTELAELGELAELAILRGHLSAELGIRSKLRLILQVVFFLVPVVSFSSQTGIWFVDYGSSRSKYLSKGRD